MTVPHATPKTAGGAVLGLDPGTRRIGVAVSDPDRKLALPLAVIERSGDWLDRLMALVEEWRPAEVVVGLPRRLDGTEGPAARDARDFAAGLSARLRVPIHLVDERMTTVAADRALAGAGASSRRRRKIVDRSAAAILLQSYLDAGAGR